MRVPRSLNVHNNNKQRAQKLSFHLLTVRQHMCACGCKHSSYAKLWGN